MGFRGSLGDAAGFLAWCLEARPLKKAPARPKGHERRAALRHRKLRGTALRVRRILCGGEALEPRQMLSVTSYFLIGANPSDFNAADNWSLTSGGTADQTFPGDTDAQAVFDSGGVSGTITISSAVTADEIDFGPRSLPSCGRRPGGRYRD